MTTAHTNASNSNVATPPKELLYYEKCHPNRDVAARIFANPIYLRFERDGKVVKLPFHSDHLKFLAASVECPLIAMLDSDILKSEVYDIGKWGRRIQELDPADVETILLELGRKIYVPTQTPKALSKEESRAAIDIGSALGLRPDVLLTPEVIAKGICQEGDVAEQVESLTWIHNGREDEFPSEYENITNNLAYILWWRTSGKYPDLVKLLAKLPDDLRAEIQSTAITIGQVALQGERETHKRKSKVADDVHKEKLQKINDVIRGYAGCKMTEGRFLYINRVINN